MVGGFYAQLYTNKFSNYEQSPWKTQFTRTDSRWKRNSNNAVPNREIEFIIKNLLRNKTATPGPDGFNGE